MYRLYDILQYIENLKKRITPPIEDEFPRHFTMFSSKLKNLRTGKISENYSRFKKKRRFKRFSWIQESVRIYMIKCKSSQRKPFFYGFKSSVNPYIIRCKPSQVLTSFVSQVKSSGVRHSKIQ